MSKSQNSSKTVFLPAATAQRTAHDIRPCFRSMQFHAAVCRARKVMKISTMFVNNSGHGISMPIGAAWHWIHEEENLQQA
jgi:hypothetical protein